MVADETRGMSPATTRMSSSPSSSLKGSSPTSAPWAEPQPSRCSTTTTRGSALVSPSFLATRSAPSPTTTTMRSTSVRGSASRTYCTIGRPHNRCSAFGRVERILAAPSAASTIADIGRVVMAAPCTMVAPRLGWPGRSRTCNLLIQSQAFYQLNYRPSRSGRCADPHAGGPTGWGSTGSHTTGGR